MQREVEFKVYQGAAFWRLFMCLVVSSELKKVSAPIFNFLDVKRIGNLVWWNFNFIELQNEVGTILDASLKLIHAKCVLFILKIINSNFTKNVLLFDVEDDYTTYF